MTLSQSKTAEIALRYAGKQKRFKAHEFVAVVSTIVEAIESRVDRLEAKLTQVERAIWRKRGAQRGKHHGS